MTEVELHVPDFAPIKTFYGALGFAEVWEANNYLVMQLGDVVLRFWPGDQSVYSHSYFGAQPKTTPRGFGVEVVAMVPNLDETYARAVQLNAVVAEMTTKPWGLRDFRIADPFGFYVRFTEPHKVTEANYGGRIA